MASVEEEEVDIPTPEDKAIATQVRLYELIKDGKTDALAQWLDADTRMLSVEDLRCREREGSDEMNASVAAAALKSYQSLKFLLGYGTINLPAVMEMLRNPDAQVLRVLLDTESSKSYVDQVPAIDELLLAWTLSASKDRPCCSAVDLWLEKVPEYKFWLDDPRDIRKMMLACPRCTGVLTSPDHWHVTAENFCVIFGLLVQSADHSEKLFLSSLFSKCIEWLCAQDDGFRLYTNNARYQSIFVDMLVSQDMFSIEQVARCKSRLVPAAEEWMRWTVVDVGKASARSVLVETCDGLLYFNQTVKLSFLADVVLKLSDAADIINRYPFAVRADSQEAYKKLMAHAPILHTIVHEEWLLSPAADGTNKTVLKRLLTSSGCDSMEIHKVVRSLIVDRLHVLRACCDLFVDDKYQSKSRYDNGKWISVPPTAVLTLVRQAVKGTLS
jgi:hypothetical protein